ncbi:hypothetical protein [Thalassolituus sp.]|uniref:hypothetical protein n=1 Tax=Thalassolituus sp. TaxID=2030822 RepID=UPI002A83B2CA|nr:hypothetical protein [Thalassolituus sp.]
MIFIRKLISSPTWMTLSAYLTKFGSGLILLPVFLLMFSTEEIAVWMVFLMISGISGVADSGIGPSLIRVTSYFYSGLSEVPDRLVDKVVSGNKREPNYKKLSVMLNTFGVVYYFLGFLFFIFVYFFGSLVSSNAISMLTPELRDGVDIAFYLILIKSTVALLIIRWMSFAQGVDRVASIRGKEAIVELLKLIVMLLVVSFANGSILEVVIVDLLGSIILLFISRREVFLWFVEGGVKFSPKIEFDTKLFNSIWPSMWRFGGMQYGSYLINNGAGIVVSQAGNASLIAAFLLTQKIMFVIRQISQTPLMAHLPTIFKMKAHAEVEKIKSFSSEKIRLGIGIQLFFSLLFVLTGGSALDILGVETNILPQSLLILYSVIMILEAHHSYHAQIYMSTNHVPFLFPGIVSGIVILSVGFFMMPYYGVLGLLLVQLVVQLMFNNWYPVFLNLRSLNWSGLAYIQDVLWKKNRY